MTMIDTNLMSIRILFFNMTSMSTLSLFWNRNFLFFWNISGPLRITVILSVFNNGLDIYPHQMKSSAIALASCPQPETQPFCALCFGAAKHHEISFIPKFACLNVCSTQLHKHNYSLDGRAVPQTLCKQPFPGKVLICISSQFSLSLLVPSLSSKINSLKGSTL